MTTRTRIFAFPLATLLVFAACTDGKSPTEGSGNNSGSLSFSYTGAIQGSFSASGVPSASEGSTWAGGEIDTDGSLLVVASKGHAQNRFDIIILQTPVAAAGTYQITETCSAEICPELAAILGIERNTNWETFERSCWLDTGSITITNVTNRRARGTFSGQGTCLSIVEQEMVEETFDITNGQFDTVLVQ
jgi:hypothetical protein